MELTFKKQIELMHKTWPDFRFLKRNRWLVYWEGPLQPLCQVYVVQVTLPRKRKYHKNQPSTFPTVTVSDPLLRNRTETPDTPIPHHYPNDLEPEKPYLCLYDPNTRIPEWHPGLPIANTIIPWTIEWLVCYEGWLATGEWTGGGRHPPVIR